MSKANMDFSEALAEMKARKTMRRREWNDTTEFVYFVEGSRFAVNRKPLNLVYAEGSEVTYRPHLDIRSKGVCYPWVPTQADLLSNDWEEVRDLLEEEAERQKSGIDRRPDVD